MSVAAREWTAERVASLLKKPKRSPTGWKACCPAHDDKNPSLFLADGSDGGLVAVCYAGCDYRSIMDALEMAGMPSRDRSRDRSRIPEEHYQLGQYHSHWDYHDKHGSVVMRVCRWEQPDGKKDIRPIVKTVEGWKWAHHPNPRPLFQLHRLTNEPEAPVIVVEGEKTAMAAQRLFPDYVATTWPGGAQATGQVDWAPLRDRRVTLVPDCDQPGRTAMRWVLGALVPLGAVVGIMDPANKFEGLPEGWDLADALKEGRDLTGFLDGPAADEPRIRANEFVWLDPKDIPPREWLYGMHYMRGMVSATAGVGGAGKSSLSFVELVSMAIGKDLLRNGAELPVGPLTVWVHNGEDPYVELQRRLGAIFLHYGLTREDLGGRLRVTSGRDSRITVAQALSDGKLIVPTEDGRMVSAEIQKHGIQVFVADPFIKVHSVNENDNKLIDEVMVILCDIAHQGNCAVEVVHHFRKTNGDAVTIDAVRGAGSIVGAARSVRLTATMSESEGQAFGLDGDERLSHAWLGFGKGNMIPPAAKRLWVKFESVNLGNAREPFEADEVGVVTRWIPPELDNSLTPQEFRAVMRTVATARMEQRRHDVRSSEWVGKLIAAALERELSDKAVKAQIRILIDRLIDAGKFVKTADPNHRAGRVCFYVSVATVEQE